METQKLYRGRLIDHLQLVVRDLSTSKRFYEAIFSCLGISIGGAGDDYFWADELFVSTKESRAAHGQLTGRVHLAFQAPSREVVHEVYHAAVEAGGVENGAPGERPYHPGYYAAFIIDPDGNNVEVVFHGPGKRSTPAVEITF